MTVRNKASANSEWSGRSVQNAEGWSRKMELAWTRNIVIQHEIFAGQTGAKRATMIDVVGELLEQEDPGRTHGITETARFRAWRREHRTDKPVRPPRSGRLVRNTATLGKLLGLDEVERDVLVLAVVSATRFDLRDVLDEVGLLSRRGVARLAALALGRPERLLVRALSADGRLTTSGVLTLSPSLAPWSSRVIVSEQLIDQLDHEEFTAAQFARDLFPVLPSSSLTLDDYSHLAEPVSLVRRLLEKALENREPGINVLIHGSTGVGKTELARLLADVVGVPLYSTGMSAADDEPLHPTERLSSVLLAQKILAQNPCLLLFDEFDDVFQPHSPLYGRSGPAKVWTNQLLETNPVPMLWLTNDVAGLDAAERRRFSFSIEVPDTSIGVRRRVLAKELAKVKATVSSPVIELLSEHSEASPAQVVSSVRVAELIGNGAVEEGTLRRVLHASDTLVSGNRPTLPPDQPPWRWDAVHCSIDPQALAVRLSSSDIPPSARLLLFGPSGTGKSEYAKQCARLLDRPLHVVRTSDLLDKWVGSTEKKIAAAFHRAQSEEAVLLIDEVDSILRDRAQAERSWEVTRVNEVLQQLEAFEGVFFATTNLVDDLDSAVLRRFDFKIAFDWVKPEQAVRLFEAWFSPVFDRPFTADEIRQIRAGCERLQELAPGDFAAVSRRLRYVSESMNIASLLEELSVEVQAKTRGRAPIGF